MKKRKRGGVACQRKKEENETECLPGDIIFEILTKLPAACLHNYGRSVCQEWADLIDDPMFIETHHSRSQAGLLLQHPRLLDLNFLEVDKGKAVLKHETRDISGSIMGTCRGMTLFCLSEEKFSLCVSNIVTKQTVELPFAPLDPEDPVLAAVGYDYRQRKFKVMCFYTDEDESYYWFFYTIGEDEAWRKVDIVSSRVPYETFNSRRWISAGGVTYGVVEGTGDSANIIAVDVGEETTWVFDAPDTKEEAFGGFIEQSKKLMFVKHGVKETVTSVYRLEDFRKSAWVRIYKFQLLPSAHKLIKRSFSYALTEDGEVLIFRRYPSLQFVAYNLRTGTSKVLDHIIWCVEVCEAYKSLVFF